MTDLEDLERLLRTRLDAIGRASCRAPARAQAPRPRASPQDRRVLPRSSDRDVREAPDRPRGVASLASSRPGRASRAGASRARLDKARFRTFAESSAVGRIADGSGRRADAIVNASTDSGGSSEQDHHRRASHRHDVMSNNFLAGLLVGLLMGGFVGTLAMALVAAGSTHGSLARKPDLPTG